MVVIDLRAQSRIKRGKKIDESSQTMKNNIPQLIFSETGGVTI